MNKLAMLLLVVFLASGCALQMSKVEKADLDPRDDADDEIAVETLNHFHNVAHSAGDKEVFTADGLGFNMVYVPGANNFPYRTNDVPHNLYNNPDGFVKPYWIGETEVTYRLWDKVRQWATTVAVPRYYFHNYGQRGSGPNTTNDHPVINIYGYDAMVFSNAITEWYNAKSNTDYTIVYKDSNGVVIRDSRISNKDQCMSVVTDLMATGFRLPTHYEWELAARWRGNDPTNTVPGYTNPYFTKGDSASGATANYLNLLATQAVAFYEPEIYEPSFNGFVSRPAKERQPNTLGLYDMSGNAWDLSMSYPFITTSNQPFKLNGGACSTDAMSLMIGLGEGTSYEWGGYFSLPFGHGDNYCVGMRLARTAKVVPVITVKPGEVNKPGGTIPPFIPVTTDSGSTGGTIVSGDVGGCPKELIEIFNRLVPTATGVCDFCSLARFEQLFNCENCSRSKVMMEMIISKFDRYNAYLVQCGISKYCTESFTIFKSNHVDVLRSCLPTATDAELDAILKSLLNRACKATELCPPDERSDY